jgi:C-terminal processing protease CtpA/Prc
VLLRPLAILALALPACGGGAVGSVGAIFGRDRDTRVLVIREAPEGAAASRAGLQPGDQIVMIDGWYVKDLDAKAIRDKLRGDVGSSVHLTVVRNGDEIHHVRVVRRELGDRAAPPPPKEERISE